MTLLPLVLTILSLIVPSFVSDDGSFRVDAVVVRAEEETRDSRVDVYVEVPFNSLTFLSASDGFEATYEVTAELHRVDQRERRAGLMQTQTWESTAATQYFAQTRSTEHADLSTNTLSVPPGRYLLNIRLRDSASNNVSSVEQLLVVRDLTGSVAVSDLILLRDYDADAGSISPIVGANVGTDVTGFRLFYEIYARVPLELEVRQQVRRVASGNRSLLRSVLGIGRERDETGGDVTYQRTEPREVVSGRNASLIDIPMADLKAGDYVVRLELLDTNGRLIDAAERVVTVRWSGLDEHISDLDQAIEQLEYIAKEREIRHIRDARTREERLARFKEFWDKRDPTPGTERNERMEEYYYRVNAANQRYTHLRDGWRTDRGYVMVLFGEPDYVERPLNFDVRPYEVWYYYRIGRRAIFIDRSGMGNFELMVPIWDERTRIR